MKKLNKKDLDSLVTGTSIFSTGGGLPVAEMTSQYKNLINQKRFPSLMSVDELRDGGFVCTAYGVGSTADAQNIDIKTLAQKAFREFSNISKQKISAIVPGEVGGETTALVLGALLDIPILDADLVGGRAVPNIEMDVFTLNDIPLTPIVVASDGGKVLIISEKISAQEIERQVREFVSTNGKSGLLVGYGISGKQAKKILPKNTISRSAETGKNLKGDSAEQLSRLLGARYIGPGMITKSSLQSIDGFVQGEIEITSLHNTLYAVRVKNEFISLQNNGDVIGAVPDSILIVDTEQLQGVHSSSVKLGMSVNIYLLPGMKMWKSKRGLEIMGPEAFNISV